MRGFFSTSGATWDDTGSCTQPKLGYTVDDAVLQLTYVRIFLWIVGWRLMRFIVVKLVSPKLL